MAKLSRASVAGGKVEDTKIDYGVTFTFPPGFKALIEGATGAGKTYAIRTLVDAGITPFIISTEPGIQAILGDIPADKCHWRYIPAAASSWDQMRSNARRINQMTFKQLCNLEDMDKRKHGQFLELLNACSNFVCDRDGQAYGSCDDWGTDRALVFDSLSGINIMALDLMVGAKPVKSESDWGVAMDNLERFINRICCGIPCHVIMNAHLEKEKDELTGSMRNMVSSLGRKLPPKIPRFFDDVILAKRVGRTWMWSTIDNMTDTKTRHLEYEDDLEPDFGQLLEGWKSMGNEIHKTVSPVEES